jgi:hypothetical protein
VNWSFAASLPVVLLAVLLWSASAWLSVTNWKRNAGRPLTAVLEGLRFFLVTLLAVTLLRPEIVKQLKRTEKPEIAILIDHSASMETRDLLSSNRVIARADWLRDQETHQPWKRLEGAARVTVRDFSPAPSLGQTHKLQSIVGTDIGSALDGALQQSRNLKAVLLLSDGDWNIGKSPVGGASRYREQSIPIFTVPVGREVPLPDLALDSVNAPAYGLFGEQISIPFRVTSHLNREVKTSIAIFNGNREESRKEITIPPQGELQDHLLWFPHAVGDAALTLKVPIEPDETIPENNQQSFNISVRVDKLHVLVVDSLPRWEYRYLRNALARDPGVDMNCVLFHPQLGPGGGRNYLSAFPGTRELLSRYDVIFLGDVGVGKGELSEKDLESVRGVVEQQSSGLVLMPGRRGRELSLLNSAISNLFPVILDTSKPEGVVLQNEAQLTLSTLGKRHLLTRFDSDENRNNELWKQLPGFFWSAAVEKSRPGSEVLAVHSSLRNEAGRVPLLVTRAAGSGKVLFMGTDSAWRWRRGVEDKFHYRFWSQVVRWMAHERHLSAKEGIRLAYSPEKPVIGDSMFLQATVLNAAGFPAEEGPVIGSVISPSGRSERLEFTAAGEGWGVFRSNFSPQEAGTYKIKVDSDRNGRSLDTQILVASPQLEKRGQPINSQVMREIATVSGGASFNLDQLEQAIDRLAILPEPKPIEKRIRLWSDPIWGGVLLGLLVLYWIGRKAAGMI